MLDEQRADKIIEVFKSLDVTSKLDALNEAREMQKQIFAGELSDAQWAKAAMRIEQLYNLTREELRVPQKRIKADMGETALPKAVKSKTVKPKKAAPVMDINEMLTAFAQFKTKTEST